MSRVSAPAGTNAKSSVSGIVAYVFALSHPDAARVVAMASACVSSNPIASSLRSTASIPAVWLCAFAVLEPAFTRSTNHVRIMPSKLIRDIVGTHRMSGQAGGCKSLVAKGTQRRHAVSLSDAVGTPRWQKSSNPAVARILRSTFAMYARRSSVSTLPPGGLVSYTIVSQ